jgi:hypothetical protein
VCDAKGQFGGPTSGGCGGNQLVFVLVGSWLEVVNFLGVESMWWSRVHGFLVCCVCGGSFW